MATAIKTVTKPISKPELIPLDPSYILEPTHALFLTHNKDSIFILDLTNSLSSLYFPPKTDGEGKDFALALSVATTVASSTPAPATVWTVKRENLVGTRFVVKDGEGKEVAEWKCPILSLHMGRATVKFLSGAGAGEEKSVVDVESTGFGRKSEVSVCSPQFVYSEPT